MKSALVSTRALWDGLKELEEQARDGAWYLPDFAAKREERLLLEFRRIIREAEIEYVSTGTAAELTGWDAGTLRRYAKLALDGDPLPEEWSNLVVRREGKEYALVLSSIPAKANRSAA